MSNARFVRNVKVSERHGSGEWKAERATSLILIPLALWGFWSAWTVSGSGYAGAAEWFRSPVNAVVLAITLLISLWHMWMGLKVVVDDYIHKPSSRTALLGLIAVLCLALAVTGVFFLVRLALGSAPLPAGLGA